MMRGKTSQKTSRVLLRAGSVWMTAAMTSLAAPALMGQAARVARVTEAALPYTAEYKLTHTQRLADGNLINSESKEIVAVDSQHRRMTAVTETALYGEQAPRTRVNVFDPVARNHSDWTAPGQRAVVVAMPEPGAPRGCTPNSTRGDGVNLGAVRSSRPRPVIEDLGTDTIQGIEAHGRRMTTTIPAGEIGNEAPLVRTSEIWTAVAPGLGGLVVRDISDDPQSGRKTRELVSLEQREPDEASFQPPSGYEIVNKTSPQTTCGVEAIPTPTE